MSNSNRQLEFTVVAKRKVVIDNPGDDSIVYTDSALDQMRAILEIADVGVEFELSIDDLHYVTPLTPHEQLVFDLRNCDGYQARIVNSGEVLCERTGLPGSAVLARFSDTCWRYSVRTPGSTWRNFMSISPPNPIADIMALLD